MVALHPPLSGIPLGFVVLLTVVEAFRMAPRWSESLAVTRRVLIIALVLSTTVTFISGYQASGSLGDLIPEVQKDLGDHHAYGRLLLINALVMGTFSWIAARALHGKKFVEGVYYATLLLQLVLTILVGSMGLECTSLKAGSSETRQEPTKPLEILLNTPRSDSSQRVGRSTCLHSALLTR